MLHEDVDNEFMLISTLFMPKTLPHTATHEVRDRCICFRTQRAARALARRFDAAFRPFGITQGQFSLMMALNRREPPTISKVAPFLAMDRTTLTAALKPLARRGFMIIERDKGDARTRRLFLTDAGRALLAEALPIWRAEHDAVDRLLLALEGGFELDGLRDGVGLLGQVDRPLPDTTPPPVPRGD